MNMFLDLISSPRRLMVRFHLVTKMLLKLKSHLASGNAERRDLESSTLLDERSLLACIVRTIPAGGRIRISSTVRVVTTMRVNS